MNLNTANKQVGRRYLPCEMMSVYVASSWWIREKRTLLRLSLLHQCQVSACLFLLFFQLSSLNFHLEYHRNTNLKVLNVKLITNSRRGISPLPSQLCCRTTSSRYLPIVGYLGLPVDLEDTEHSSHCWRKTRSSQCNHQVKTTVADLLPTAKCQLQH